MKKFAPYDPCLGSTVMPYGKHWIVVAPSGRIVEHFRYEYPARDYAQYLNLTTTKKEWLDDSPFSTP